MLESNHFDAVRISLASPEQIRGWSYGEVTKPETINYRTLKPEKDGLFCEKIFGPTKDFECYCGKYKRIRFKGIVCDKCGVEVARARVRRERMGHIEMAAPIAHIWFAKGTPSHMAQLIDVSPRSLERVIYFARFIVISVDEEARTKALKETRDDFRAEFTAREEEAERQIGALRSKADEEIKQMSSSKEAPEVKEAFVRGKEAALLEEISQLRSKLDDEKSKAEEQHRRDMDAFEDLKVGALLTESKYRELKDKNSEVFEAGTGAEAVLRILENLNLEKEKQKLVTEVNSTTGQRRKKASKRLRITEAFIRSGNKPSWMVLTVLPVLPPELRPMIQLDGGRFATSDLNDLYRRVINRNNRLRRLLELGAPEIILRNEKRMLQEAVDSLIDNERRGRSLSSTGTSAKLRSLSGMLRGKQGRFRQNLLGKRVDYSGRSVIVVGPELKLHQCGLPRRMAMELFKPFVMQRLVASGAAHNIKSARRIVEKSKTEVWDILEEVVKERPVLLNRAPTLHRLSVQAFEPVLIDGSAIQIHPLVCAAFNADFDGDQMAVHIPLSPMAVREARAQLLSIHNMLLPSSGEPTVAPTLDIVLGLYYLTSLKPETPGTDGKQQPFASFEDARLAYDLGQIDLREPIVVRDGQSGVMRETSVGRIILNQSLPEELRFSSLTNNIMDKSALKALTAECIHRLGNERTADILDSLKRLGFLFATKSGTTIAMGDVKVPPEKAKLLAKAEEEIELGDSQFQRGLITEDERYEIAVRVWNQTTDKITELISHSLDRYEGIHMMTTSGAKGNISQIRQMAGMRGLMTDPAGRIIDFPIRSSFREGLSVLEYFISTHGARKGLADTALRTSDSGYLTRRLIDVAQDVLVLEEDCGTPDGIWMTQAEEKGILPPLEERLVGRLAAQQIVHPKTKEVLAERNERIDQPKARAIVAAGITRAHIRSPLICATKRGVCQSCYGDDLARHQPVNLGTAVGIIAAQSIGEPGTQLTMRTFHTGGVVGLDITSGLPRVEELLEARVPKGEAILSEIDGVAEVIHAEEGRKIKVARTEVYQDEYVLPPGAKLLVENSQMVDMGTVLAQPKGITAGKKKASSLQSQPIIAQVAGKVTVGDNRLFISYEERDEREYLVSAATRIRIKSGDTVKAGEQITDGTTNPQHILSIKGKDAVQRYLVDEVQRVYRSQGVNINDKHIEVIVRQMLSKVQIDQPGDTEFTPGRLVDRFKFDQANEKILAEGGEAATAHIVLLGITRISLNTDSWLAAASFQETTRVLTEASIAGKKDKLIGLKENVIIGKLIPSRFLAEPVAPETVDFLLPEPGTEEALEPTAPEEITQPV
jgi:DNA-directed RNA polymerase subunit beta'